MKTNNNPTSGKRLAQLLALCLLATFPHATAMEPKV